MSDNLILIAMLALLALTIWMANMRASILTIIFAAVVILATAELLGLGHMGTKVPQW